MSMKPIPLDPAIHMAPITFSQEHLDLAREMKQRGLTWQPHVGCFVWDYEEHIQTGSPFPLRVYFILSLHRFIKIFGNLEAVADRLLWLPTWHQARQLAALLGVDQERIADLLSPDSPPSPGDELLGIYRLILEAL